MLHIYLVVPSKLRVFNLLGFVLQKTSGLPRQVFRFKFPLELLQMVFQQGWRWLWF